MRADASRLDLRVCVDGLGSDVTALRHGFCVPVRTGRRVTGAVQRVKQDTSAAIAAVLAATNSGLAINPAYIERLNATCHSHLAPLVRRGRAIARTDALLTAGRWLVGSAYNCC